MARYNRDFLVPYLHDVAALSVVKENAGLDSFSNLLGVLFGRFGIFFGAVAFLDGFAALLLMTGIFGKELQDNPMPMWIFVTVFVAGVIILLISIPATKKAKARRKMNQQKQQRASELLNRVYAQNVIPNQYRTVGCAVYLYNWFSTSASDDLDLALNTCAHESADYLNQLVQGSGREIVRKRIMGIHQNAVGTALSQEVDQFFVSM